MFKLILILGAGAFIYTMGQNAASASIDGAPAKEPAVWEQAAATGGTLIARELHKHTAWAADAEPPAIEIQPTLTIAAN